MGKLLTNKFKHRRNDLKRDMQSALDDKVCIGGLRETIREEGAVPQILWQLKIWAKVSLSQLYG